MFTARADESFDAPPLTKIIATVGPASASAEVIGRLIEAGVSVFRLNFSHGRLDQHERAVQTIRTVARELGALTAILGDLQGPKIRVGQLPETGVSVETGATVRICREQSDAAGDICISTTYPALVDDVQPGERVLINDGAVRMLAIDTSRDEIICTVTHGGVITTAKGINLPDSTLTVQVMTQRDWDFATWAVEHDLDLLALSFVRTAEDVQELQRGLEQIKQSAGRPDLRMPIVAKIELPKAVQNIEAILDVADAIMVARGDLGVEMDLARVPVIQKRLMQTADTYGKPCIVATQMLESMVHSPTPTRAEASDVAGAIFDAADAVMLSGETAIGSYPAVAVEHMRRIAHYTEQYLAELPQKTSAPQKLIETRYRTAALAHGVWTVVQDVKAKLVIVWSQQGGGARYLSQNNFRVPVFAVTSDERAARRMQLFRGVTPILMPAPGSIAEFASAVDKQLLDAGRAEPGDLSVLVAGEPIGREGITNTLAIHAIGKPDVGVRA